MKKRLLFSIVAMIALLFSSTLLTAQDRNISGTVLNCDATMYYPGSSPTWTFDFTNMSVDGEYITSAYITFPAGVTVNNSTDFLDVINPGNGILLDVPGGGQTGAGPITVTWSVYFPPTPPIPPAGNAVATSDVTIDPGMTGSIIISYTLVGDATGASPHSVGGTITLDPPIINTVDTYVNGTPGNYNGSGTGGALIVGDQVTVESNIEDASISSITADFSMFGGPAAENMALVRGNDYTATYTITESSVADGAVDTNYGGGPDDPLAFVTVNADAYSLAAAETYDVDNIVPDVVHWGAFAISYDDNSNGIAEDDFPDEVTYTVGMETTGDATVEWEIPTNEFLAWFNTANGYTQGVDTGTLDNELWNPTIHVYDNDGNEVTGNSDAGDQVAVDNEPPLDLSSATGYFEINPGARAIVYAGVGDVIRAVVDLTTVPGHNIIDSGEFNFYDYPGPGNTGVSVDPADDAIVHLYWDGDVMYCDYIIQEGDNDILASPGLQVEVTLFDAASLVVGTYVVDVTLSGDELHIDANTPVLGGSSYDLEMYSTYLRYSPDTQAHGTPYLDIPDDIIYRTRLTGGGSVFGDPGYINKLVVRIDEVDTRALIGFKVYEYDSSLPLPHNDIIQIFGGGQVRLLLENTYNDADGDGVIDGSYTIDDGLIGLTLWSATDVGGNEALQGYMGDPNTTAFDGGESAFAVIQPVVDNIPPEFLPNPFHGLVEDDSRISTLIFSEDFEAGIPVGWQVIDNGGDCVWTTTDITGRTNLTGGAGEAATADSDVCGAGTTMDTELITPLIPLTSDQATLEFKAYYNDIGSGDYFALDISIDAGSNWTNIFLWVEDHFREGPTREDVSIDLSSYIAGATDMMLRFTYVATGWDWYAQIDELRLYEEKIYVPQYGSITLNRTLIDNDWDGTPDAVLSYENLLFEFDVKRDYQENSDPARHEQVEYLIEVEDPLGGFFYFYEGSGDVLHHGVGAPADIHAAGDVTNFGNSAFATVSGENIPELMWNPDDFTLFPAGFYEAEVYLQDDAGNIALSSTRFTIEIVDEITADPKVTAVLIDPNSAHNALGTDPNGLPSTFGGSESYYVTATDANYIYDASNIYFQTADVLSFDVTVFNPNDVDELTLTFPAAWNMTDVTVPISVATTTFNVNIADIDQLAADATTGLPTGDLYTITDHDDGDLTDDILITLYQGLTAYNAAAPVEAFDQFNLIRPPYLGWPTINDLSLLDGDGNPSNMYMSPGDANFVYASDTNPANDNVPPFNETAHDIMDFDITIDASDFDYTWQFEISKPAYPDTYTQIVNEIAPVVLNNNVITFDGRQNTGTLPLPLVDPTGEATLDYNLAVTFTDNADLYYVRPDDPANSDPGYFDFLSDFYVDNKNPQILNPDGSDPGVTRELNIGYEPYVATSNSHTTFTFNIQTSEPMPETGWNAVVVDEMSNPIGAITAALTVVPVGTAVPDPYMPTNDYYTEFEITADIQNMVPGDENLDAILNLISPNDKAGNPSNVNNPVYPYNSATYWEDSAEGYVRFMILEEIPFISNIWFRHEKSIGFVNNLGLIHNGWTSESGTFDFKVMIQGIAYLPIQVRDIGTILDVDFSAFGLGAPEEAAYTVLADDGGKAYTIYWEDVAYDLSGGGLATGDPLDIPVTLELDFTPPDDGHTYVQNMTLPIFADVDVPTVTIGTPVPVRESVFEGTSYLVDVTIDDPDAGVDFLSNTLTCDDPAIGISGGPVDDMILMWETFDAVTRDLPLDWTIVDGFYDGLTWNGSGYGGSTDYMGVQSWSPVAQRDEQLISPVLNAEGMDNLTIDFVTQYVSWPFNASPQYADVDVWDGSAWINVWHWEDSLGDFSDYISLDVSDYANEFFQVRFHYWDTIDDYIWLIDDVIVHNWGVMRDTQVVTWQIDIPEDHPNRTFTLTSTCLDNVANEGSITADWDVVNVPELDVYDFDNDNTLALDHLRNGDDATLIVGIRDPERVDAVHVSLNTDFTYPPVRDLYGPGDVLTLTIADFLALDSLDVDRINPTWEYRYLPLQNINLSGTVPECSPIIATVTIDHPYSDPLNPDGRIQSSDPSWLVVDNSAPTVQNITYDITTDVPLVSAFVTITAEIFDNPIACASGINENQIYLNLLGVNGLEVVPEDSYVGGVATWNLHWPEDFSNPLSIPANIDGFIHVSATDNLGNGPTTESLQIDTQPVILDVQWYINGQATDVILPDDNGAVWVDVTVEHTEDHMDYVLTDRLFLEYQGTNLTGWFDSYDPDYAPVRITDTTFRFEPGFGFDIPEAGYDVADFELWAVSIYNFFSETVDDHIVVVDYPRENFFGDTAIEDPVRSYIGRDPDGWFAPEHNVHAELTVWSPYTMDEQDVNANFDYLGDFVDPWFNAEAISYITHEFDLDFDTVPDFTLYEYLFEWDVITDAQSIWNGIIPPISPFTGMPFMDPGQIFDGKYIPIEIEALVMWVYGLLPTKYIQVDMNDPGYSTADGNMFYHNERAIPNGFDVELYLDDSGSLIPFYHWVTGETYWDDGTLTMTVELPITSVPDWGETFILRTYATDFTNSMEHPSINGGGSGVDEIYMPSSPDFGIGVYAAEPSGVNGAGVHYQNWEVTPNFPINHGDTAMMSFNAILDLCNHSNSVNPTINFEFVADYDGVDTSQLLINTWKGYYEDPLGSGIMWPNTETAPYVQAGGNYQVSLPIDPFLLRDTGIDFVAVNTTMLDNYCVDTAAADLLGPNWTMMGWFPDTGLFIYDGGPVDPAYADGDEIFVQIMVTYNNGSTWESGWITSSRTENYAIVDGVDPYIVEGGINIWSETLGLGEEGYVCPDDRNGQLQITFWDNLIPADYDFNAVPDVWVEGLDQFVFGWNLDGVPYGGNDPSEYDIWPVPAGWLNISDMGAVFTHDGTNWIATLSGMAIQRHPGLPTQYTIEVFVDDPVFNTSYDPANPSTRFVEIQQDGPIVPVITGMEVFIGDRQDPAVPFYMFDPGNPLNGWADDTGLEFWIGEGNTLEEEVTIHVICRAGYEAYIEDMWLDLSAFDGYTDYEQVEYIEQHPNPIHNNVWRGVYHMPSTMLAEIREDVTITGHTIRHPFGAIDVFTDEFEVTIHVDTEDAQVDDAVVYNNVPGFEDVMWTINPDGGMHVMAVIGDLRGALGTVDGMDWPMPSEDDLRYWFYLQNDGNDVVFDSNDPYFADEVTYPEAYRDGEEEIAVVEWYFDYTDLDEYWWDVYAGETEVFNFDIHYKNIYTEWFVTNTDMFNGGAGVLVDNQAPVFNGGFSYGENHEANETIVPYYTEFNRVGDPWDEYAYLSVDYDDVSGLKYITSDWSWFEGSSSIVSYPYGPRAVELFEFVYGPSIYDIDPEISKTGDVDVMLTDSVGNDSDDFGIVTTFVFEENMTFAPQVFEHPDIIFENGAWYTKDGPVKMFADHTVMGFDTIDNDVDTDVDEAQEGFNAEYDPLDLQVNNHENDNWYPFPHTISYDGDVTLFELQAQYGNFTEGLYSIHVFTENIFGHHLDNYVDFAVDHSAPYVTHIHLGALETYDMNDVIISNSDWEYIQVDFVDPAIMEARIETPGVGVDFVSDEYNGMDSTYVVLRDSEGADVPGLLMLPWDGNNYCKIVPDDSRGWASDNLVSGEYYTLYIYTWDKLGNYAEYTKEFFYNSEPAEIELHVFDHNFIQLPAGSALQVSNEIAYLGASVDDEFGMVNEVRFDVYFDANNNNVFDPDDPEYMHLLGEPDFTVPYEATWNIMDLDLMADAAEYIEHINVYNYDGTLRTRDWFIKVTALSNSNAVAEITYRQPVTDDIGPAPMLTDLLGPNVTLTQQRDTSYYTMLYNYDDIQSNISQIQAWCKYDSDMDGDIDEFDLNWPDAWYVNFFIEGPGYASPFEIGNIYQEIGSPYYLANWDWNDLAIDYPGTYTITIEGYDRVNNVAMGLNTFQVEIYTAGNAWSEIDMVNFDVPNWDNEWPIESETEYGPLNPVQNILNLRLDATVHNFHEVQYFGFYYDVIDNVTGLPVETMVPCPNDQEINPDMPADASMILPWMCQIYPIGNGDYAQCSIVVPEDVYRGTGYNEEDYTFVWYIMVTDYTNEPFLHADSEQPWFRVDYVAPVAYMMEDDNWFQGDDNQVSVLLPADENTPDEYGEGYIFNGLDHSMVFKWSYDGYRTWFEFEPGDADIFETEGLGQLSYTFDGWDTYMIDQLDVYNYEGYVWVTCEVQDRRGNWSEAEPTQLYIDNQAPEAPITQVAYRAPMEYDGFDPSPYLQWHNLGSLTNEQDNTINVAYNSVMTSEDAYLRLRVHQTEILNLSNYNIPVGDWADLMPPITLYYGPGDEVGPEYVLPWNLFDHEPDFDGYYHFEIPLEETGNRDLNFDPEMYHYFAFVAQDNRGNMEGDLDHSGDIYDDEFAAMWDLRVYLVADDPIITEIAAPNSTLNPMGEWIHLAAEVVEDIFSVGVDEMTFQWSATGHPDEWTDIATVPSDSDGYVPYFFHIYRHEIPGFDELPYVPGIHVFDAFGNELGDMNNIPVTDPYGNFDMNNGPQGAWYKYIDLPVGNNQGIYYIADLNDDGIITAADYDLDIFPEFIHPNENISYEVTEWTVAFNTEEVRLADGLYYFRAVPDGDARGATTRFLQIDNTTPTVAIDIVDNDMLMPEFAVGEVIDFVTDIDDLIVFDDDFSHVVYQYSSQAPGTEFRQWHYMGETDDLTGDFLMQWTAVDPQNDNTDNDGDGYVDEADEANAFFYVRSYAMDPAGNYGYSEEQPMIIDGSNAYMHIAYINGEVPAGPNYVVDIPENNQLELIASDITPEDTFGIYEDGFDGAVFADFWFAGNGWTQTLIAENVPVDPETGYATCIWNLEINGSRELLEEGNYTLWVVAEDRVENVHHPRESLPTHIILNDVSGPEAYIYSVGGQLEVDASLLFFANAAGYDPTCVEDGGGIYATLTNPEDVATVTFEYSIDGTTWHNINTIDYDGGDRDAAMVCTDWELPYEEDMTYYLRAFVEDYQANDTIVPVTFYYDNTIPALAADPEITTILTLNEQPVLDVLYNDVITSLVYDVDPNHGLYDVASVEVELLPIPEEEPRTPPTGYVLGTNTYIAPGVDTEMFTTDLTEAVSDEYELWVTLWDFAGNEYQQNFYYIVIDVDQPEFDPTALVHITDGHYQTPWYAVSDGNPIEFWYAEEDYLDDGVQPENDAFLGVETATLSFVFGEEMETAEGVFDVDRNISFSWTPDLFATYLYQGILVQMTLVDYYGNTTTENMGEFRLYDLDPTLARIITVDGNMVDWQEEEVPDVSATGDGAWIKSYVPVSMDRAQVVDFEWFDGEDWIVLGSVFWENAAHSVYPPYEYPLSDEFSYYWNLIDVPNGIHQIRTIAYDVAGFAMPDLAGIVNVSVNNCLLEDVLPVPYVWDGGAAATELVRGNIYQTTATSDCPTMITDITWWYRYTDENGMWLTDDWFEIGFDADGEDPYLFDNWVIENYYIPGLNVRVIAMPDFVDDPSYMITPQELVDMGLYVELGVVDVTAPVVEGIGLYEFPREMQPVPLGYYINNLITQNVNLVISNIMTEYPAIFDQEDWRYQNDVLRVKLSYEAMEDRALVVLDDYWLNDEDDTNPYEYIWNNYGAGWDISMLDEGVYTLILEVWDTAENMTTYTQEFFIDVTPPVSALTITDLEGNDVDYLERGETYMLHANAEDFMIFSYAYEYVVDGETTGIEGDAAEVEFTVPDDIDYGSLITFNVEVTDMVGLTHDSSVSRLVFDPDTTEIIITDVGGVPYVPELHINGESVTVEALLLGNFAPDQITQVAFKYRYTGEVRNRDWALIDPDDPVVQVNLEFSTAQDDWDVSDLAEGDVEIGVVPVTDPDNIFEEPLWWASLYIDHTPPVMPEPVVTIPQWINGDELRVEFATLPEDLNHGMVRFEYAIYDQAGIPEAWNVLEITPDFGFNGNWFFVIDFDDERIAPFDNGQVYDFRLRTFDVAVDEPNEGIVDEIDFAGGVLFDSSAPAVFISQINDEIAPFDAPVEVELGAEVDITAIAFEMPGEYPGVSDIAYVEFYTDQMGGYLIGAVDAPPYTISGVILGLEVGEIDIYAVAYDNAGNWTESELVTIEIVSNIDPIAYIAGFDFDAENANLDYIYAVTKDCVDNQTDYVRFEYKTNMFSEWTIFAPDVEEVGCGGVNGVKLWRGEFNANAMDVEQIRAVAVKMNGEDSERFAFLNVTYVEDEMYPDGYFTFDTNEDVVIFYDDIVDISNAESKPYTIALNEVLNNAQDHTVQLLDPIQTVSDPNRYTAPVEITGINNIYGNMITVWTSTSTLYDENIEMIHLENAMTMIYPITAANGSNGLIGPEFGMHVNVPLNAGTGHIYFEPLHMPEDYIPIPTDWVPLAPQVAIQGDVEEGEMFSDFNIEFQPDPNNNGNLFGARYVWDDEDGWYWETYPANEEGWFAAPLRTGIYTFVAIANADLNVQFVTVSNEWWDGVPYLSNLWTQCEESITIFSEDEEEPEVILNGVDFSFRTFIFEDEGEYEVDPTVGVDVYLDGIKIVDYGVADPEWVAEDITISPVSGIFHVKIVNCEYLWDDMTHQIEVDVYKNGYSAEAVQAFNVDYTGPAVDNDGGGYVRHGMSISAVITDPQTLIFMESMSLRLYNPEDMFNLEEQILIDYASMEVVALENGYQVSYELTLDDLTTVLLDDNDVNEIYAEWSAINNVGIGTIPGMNVVVYVVDIAPPIVWAVSPVGDPLDNDGDGLFNEDPINGINEDLDFDDWNNNGVQDGMWVSDSSGTYWIGEPSLIDEDPIDFWPDTLMYGTDIVVSVAYEDIPMPIMVGDEYCGDCAIYSGASGVDPEGIVVTLNGDIIEGFANNGVWQHDAGTELLPGHYVVIASVPDMIGNVGMVSFEFEIIGPAPTIVFDPFMFNDGTTGWWYNPEWNDEIAFEFTVNTLVEGSLAEDGVAVSFYTLPDHIHLQGPNTVTLPGGSNNYHFEVNLGSDIPNNQLAVVIEVEATNIWGDYTVNSQSYGLDSSAPNIEFISPDDGEIFGVNQAISIFASYTDFQEEGREIVLTARERKANVRVDADRDRPMGSGIASGSARLIVIGPQGTIIDSVSGGTEYVQTVLTPLNDPGQYTAYVFVEDRVGNSSVASVEFEVESSAPSVAFMPFGEAGYWFNPYENQMPFVFNVMDNEGIPQDGVMASFYTVPGNELLQGPSTLTPVSVNGDTYEYAVNLGANVPSTCTGVSLVVSATNIHDANTVSSQVYGIDIIAPEISFISPEDGAMFELDATVNILAVFNDINDQVVAATKNHQTRKPVDQSDRNIGSGIAMAMLTVYDPLGAIVVEAETGMNSQSINAMVTELISGTYTVMLEVHDKVGNVAVDDLNFMVDDYVAEDLTIEFAPYGIANWWGPQMGLPFEFMVEGEVATNGIVVAFYGMPGGVLLQGPQIVGSSAGTHHVYMNADVSADYTNLMLEVSATNISGTTTVNSETYGIDLDAPMIAVDTPADGANFSLDDEIVIRANISDYKSGVNAESIVLKVDDVVAAFSFVDGTVLYTAPQGHTFDTGIHVIELTALDNVNNMAGMIWRFNVNDSNVEFEISEAHTYPNPVDFEENGEVTFMIETSKISNLVVTIYDFAGNEVIQLKGDNRSALTWDGRTAKGTKVARGIYFAKVAANDGGKIVEKVVKIAVKG